MIPESGRSPREGNGYPLQYSCLENSMDTEAWRATVHWGCKESDTTELLHFHFQYLTSTLAQEGEVVHLFWFTCSIVLQGGRNTANKYHWHVWATLGLPPLMVCVLSQSTLLSLQVALQGNCLKRALGCVHFPGQSHSGSGSWILHKGAYSVGLAFCALPRFEQLRRPGAC